MMTLPLVLSTLQAKRRRTHYCQRWQAPDLPAELAKRIICACVREICFFRDFMDFKSHKFSWSILARHLYARQLACEPQTGSVACLSVAVRKDKNDQFSQLKVYIQKHAGCCCCFYCASMQGQTMLKIHGNLR